jgi:hypothetical protein
VVYSQLFYQAEFAQQLDTSMSYEMLAASLEEVSNAQPFSTPEELSGSIRGRNQKYLALTNSQKITRLLTHLK